MQLYLYEPASVKIERTSFLSNTAVNDLEGAWGGGLHIALRKTSYSDNNDFQVSEVVPSHPAVRDSIQQGYTFIPLGPHISSRYR